MNTLNSGSKLVKLHALVGDRAVFLPLKFGFKKPHWTGWQQTTFKATRSVRNRGLLAAAFRRGNIGVLLGKASGNLVTIDIDTDDEIEAFLSLNPQLARSSHARCSRLSDLGQDHWTVSRAQDQVRAVEAPAVEIPFNEINWPERWRMNFDGKAEQQDSPPPPREGEICELDPKREERVLCYIRKVDPAISGQGGSNPTYRLANLLWWGFSLSRDLTVRFMHVYNGMRCRPLWSAKDIEHKVDDAIKDDHGDRPLGYLWGEEEPTDFGGIAPEEPAPKPKLSDEALYGILGDVTRLISPQSEADPAAIYFQFLVAFGNSVGHEAFFLADGNSKHFTNLFVTLVGRSSKGRKGTALGYVKALFAQADPFYSTQFAEGLSTGEGLIFAVRNPSIKIQRGKEVVDEGVTDKRLLLIETEFARPLKVMARPTNILSTVLRNFWDTGDSRTMTRTDPLRAIGAHVSMSATLPRRRWIRN